MSPDLLDSDSLTRPPDTEFGSPEVAPSAAVDARVLRLAHATLLAGRGAPELGTWEAALSGVLIAGYAVYAATQVMQIFWRVITG